MSEDSVKPNRFAGMTANERLLEAGMLDGWDTAVRKRDRAEMIRLLEQVELGSQAGWIADTVLANPARYGF